MTANALIFQFPSILCSMGSVESKPGAHREAKETATLPFSELSDEDLVVHMQSGDDTRAFDELVRRHQGMIVGILYHFCPHKAELEDLAQETFIKAYRKIDQWKPSGTFVHWLKRIAYNTGYDYFRSNRRNPIRLAEKEGEKADNYLEQIPQAEQAVQETENTELVQKILSHLPPDDRMILTLQYLKEFSITEIADQMGWSESKIKVRSFRAKKKLKKVLERYEIGSDI